jgi:hypothetical protein
MQEIAGIIYTPANSQEKILDLLKSSAEYHLDGDHMVMALHHTHFRCTCTNFNRARGLLVYQGWKEVGNGTVDGKKHLQLMGGPVAKPMRQSGPEKTKWASILHFVFNRFKRR